MSKIRIKQGDCLELMKSIPDKSVDMILCDLPYGTTNCSWDIIIPFDLLWEQYRRIIKDNKAIVLFGSEPFTSKLICSNIEHFKHDWVWEKQKASNFMLAKKQPLKYHENICVFSYGTPAYIPQKYPVLELEEIMTYDKNQMKNMMENREYDRFAKIDRRKTVNDPVTNKEHLGNDIIRNRNADDGTRYPKSVLKINKSINKNIHPTEKPVALLEYLIKTYSNEDDVVLDNCMGSGSTGIACINLNRNFIGIEKDEKYFNLAKERLDEHKKNCEVI